MSSHAATVAGNGVYQFQKFLNFHFSMDHGHDMLNIVSFLPVKLFIHLFSKLQVFISLFNGGNCITRAKIEWLPLIYLGGEPSSYSINVEAFNSFPVSTYFPCARL